MKNLVEFWGLPPEFGVAILLVSFALLLSPYFGGVDFGILKIPDLPLSARKWLYIVGPLFFAASIAAHVPLIENQPLPQTETEPLRGKEAEPPDDNSTDVNMLGLWQCEQNDGSYTTNMTITNQINNTFKGKEKVIAGPCCIGVISDIYNGTIQDSNIRFTKTNEQLASPQRFDGTLVSKNEITGLFEHQGASYDFVCNKS